MFENNFNINVSHIMHIKASTLIFLIFVNLTLFKGWVDKNRIRNDLSDHMNYQFLEFLFTFLLIFFRYGTKLQSLSWSDVYDAEFPQFMLIIEVFNCLPPTSVQCETTFSQMKFIKTSRRTKLSTSTLNSILLVKLLSPSVEHFNPNSSVDKWLVINKLQNLYLNSLQELV